MSAAPKNGSAPYGETGRPKVTTRIQRAPSYAAVAASPARTPKPSLLVRAARTAGGDRRQTTAALVQTTIAVAVSVTQSGRRSVMVRTRAAPLTRHEAASASCAGAVRMAARTGCGARVTEGDLWPRRAISARF